MRPIFDPPDEMEVRGARLQRVEPPMRESPPIGNPVDGSTISFEAYNPLARTIPANVSTSSDALTLFERWGIPRRRLTPFPPISSL